MIKAEAREIKERLLSDVGELSFVKNKNHQKEVAILIAKKLKEATNDGVYEYVINDLNLR